MIDLTTADSIGMPTSSLVAGERPQSLEECVGKIVRCTAGTDYDRAVVSFDDTTITFRDVGRNGTLGSPQQTPKSNASVFIGPFSHFMRPYSAPVLDLAGNPLHSSHP